MQGGVMPPQFKRCGKTALRAFGPGGEILLLLWGELIDLRA